MLSSVRKAELGISLFPAYRSPGGLSRGNCFLGRSVSVEFSGITHWVCIGQISKIFGDYPLGLYWSNFKNFRGLSTGFVLVKFQKFSGITGSSLKPLGSRPSLPLVYLTQWVIREAMREE